MDKKTLKQLKADVQDVLKQHPELSVKEKNGIPSLIKGNYVVRDERGVSQGSFKIKVVIPLQYPYAFPKLYETSNRIERIISRHIALVGLVCEEIDQQELIIAARGITLKTYFEQYVHKYFCWQLLYEVEGSVGLEEWSHHSDGVNQFYAEYLKLTDNAIITEFLRLLTINQVPGRNKPCPCGSGKKTKQCHEKEFNDLKSIGKQQLVKDYQMIVTSNKAA